MDKMKMLEARIPEKEKLVKQLKPNKKELEKIEQLVKVSFNDSSDEVSFKGGLESQRGLGLVGGTLILEEHLKTSIQPGQCIVAEGKVMSM